MTGKVQHSPWRLSSGGDAWNVDAYAERLREVGGLVEVVGLWVSQSADDEGRLPWEWLSRTVKEHARYCPVGVSRNKADAAAKALLRDGFVTHDDPLHALKHFVRGVAQ